MCGTLSFGVNYAEDSVAGFRHFWPFDNAPFNAFGGCRGKPTTCLRRGPAWGEDCRRPPTARSQGASDRGRPATQGCRPDCLCATSQALSTVPAWRRANSFVCVTSWKNSTSETDYVHYFKIIGIEFENGNLELSYSCERSNKYIVFLSPAMQGCWAGCIFTTSQALYTTLWSDTSRTQAFSESHPE